MSESESQTALTDTWKQEPHEVNTDVLELCTLLQCLGFTVKSLDTSDANVSQDAGARTVVVNCQTSGLHVVMESPAVFCSCPASQNSGFWQVSGCTGGKLRDKESGSTLLPHLPVQQRSRMTSQLREMVRAVQEETECERDINKRDESGCERDPNKSASLNEIHTPEKRYMDQLKAETPTRYRSLDTLTSSQNKDEPLSLPALQKFVDVDDGRKKNIMCRRQSTYTISSTPGSVQRRNKTSSPIRAPSSTLLENLIAAEKVAEDLRNKLAIVIRDVMDEKNDSSMSSLVLDVSKISMMKGAEISKSQFASSPNLSVLGTVKEELTKSRLKRFDSASTSNLVHKETKTSKLRRISPNIFKSKKEVKDKSQEGKSKMQSLFKPRIVTPVRVPKLNAEASPNLSARKKFSHVKSTIPRPAPKKE